METPFDEIYISVDVETAGPNPGGYSLLSIGACLVFDPAENFYVEIQPVHEAVSPEALQVSGLNLEQLKARGLPPGEAMERFSDWLLPLTPQDRQPVFVAFNAPFDWMFVADYLHRYLGRNPFGHKALDIKAFYMGMSGTRWIETGFKEVAARYGIQQPLPHHALQDAIVQAELFQRMLMEHKGIHPSYTDHVDQE